MALVSARSVARFSIWSGNCLQSSVGRPKFLGRGGRLSSASLCSLRFMSRGIVDTCLAQTFCRARSNCDAVPRNLDSLWLFRERVLRYWRELVTSTRCRGRAIFRRPDMGKCADASKDECELTTGECAAHLSSCNLSRLPAIRNVCAETSVMPTNRPHKRDAGADVSAMGM